MKWVIWNKTRDLFWTEDQDQIGYWTTRYEAKKYTLTELEQKLNQPWSESNGDLVLAVVAVYL